jgi:hypothetical protein
MSEPKENDIYRWSWRQGRKSIISCYAHLAVYLDGRLRDTYWHDWRTQSDIDLDCVDLTLLGNIDDCREIKTWDAFYYDPADIIDMRHANNSSAPIYLKLTAEKSPEHMLQVVDDRMRQAYSQIVSAERLIKTLDATAARIRAGDLEVML